MAGVFSKNVFGFLTHIDKSSEHATTKATVTATATRASNETSPISK